MEPDPEDVKKKLEAIVGRELVVAPEQLINSRFPTSTYEYSVGKVAWQHIFLPGMSCLDAELVDVSGAAHMVAGDQNDAFSQAVVDFLERDIRPSLPR